MKFLLLAVTLLLATPLSVYAHVLETNGSVGAVLHVDPNDDPIAGQPATFYLEIKDETGKFNGQFCECTVRLTNNGQVVYSQKLSFPNQIASGSANFSYTPPDPGVYTVRIVGTPITDGQFQPFNLSYDLRVSQGNQVPQGSDGGVQSNIKRHSLHYILFGAGFIIIFILYLRDKHRQRIKFPEKTKN